MRLARGSIRRLLKNWRAIKEKAVLAAKCHRRLGYLANRKLSIFTAVGVAITGWLAAGAIVRPRRDHSNDRYRRLGGSG
jgi:hypothetical protein